MKQQTLAMAADQGAGFEQYRRPTRRDVFLETMNEIVPWAQLCEVIEPHYPKGEGGRPPKGLERMLRRLRQRALRQDETRQRIVDATVKLHTTVGPARTTVKAIAESAGVERLTVYRHFPNVDALFEACTTRGRLLWPPPQPAAWASIADPRARLKTALRDVYGYYQKRGDGLAVIMRDINGLPAWLQEALWAQQQVMIKVLMRGWPDRSGRLLRAALAHAINFYTYRSLVHDQGLKVQEAIELMMQFVSRLGDH